MKLESNLNLNRCPHCAVDEPNLNMMWQITTKANNGTNQRDWGIYKCERCGGIVTASANPANHIVHDTYPTSSKVDETLPLRVKAYLQQAIDSTFAPAGSLMLCASAVDAMLKEKGLKNGTLNSRIKEAVKSHMITPDMESWAHHVRLEANDQRHSDDNAELPTVEDAQKAIEFTKTLADLLFILPARIRSGIQSVQDSAEQL